jgi:hypothetical protein
MLKGGGRGEVNIEHRTFNIEHRRGRGRGRGVKAEILKS